MTNTLPQGFRVRPPTMDDIQAVTELFVACDIADYGEPDTTEEQVRTRWQMPSHNLAADSWLVIAPDGQIVGYSGVAHDIPERMRTSPRVYPHYRDLGIRAYLLSLAEARAHQLVSEARPGARVTLTNWFADVDEGAKRLLERAGYTPVRGHWQMEIELQQLPSMPLWPEGITLHIFRQGQERAVFDAMDEAFQDHWGHIPGQFEMWMRWTLEQKDFDPSLWFIAFDGDEIAGMSLCEYERGMGIGWVGDLAVRRPWRRKGLGLALLLYSFGEFYQRGIRRIGLGVDSQNLTGATRLYERAGMHKTRQDNSYEKELRAGVELSTQAITV